MLLNVEKEKNELFFKLERTRVRMTCDFFPLLHEWGFPTPSFSSSSIRPQRKCITSTERKSNERMSRCCNCSVPSAYHHRPFDEEERREKRERDLLWSSQRLRLSISSLSLLSCSFCSSLSLFNWRGSTVSPSSCFSGCPSGPAVKDRVLE